MIVLENKLLLVLIWDFDSISLYNHSFSKMPI